MQRTYHVILMKNIIGCSRDNVARLYDMKGSSHDREVIRPNRMYGYQELRIMTLKDMDFRKLEGCLHIEKESAQLLYNSLRLDSIFLKNLNLIDYSLLVAKVYEELFRFNGQKIWTRGPAGSGTRYNGFDRRRNHASTTI
jgi:hypothetical protein